ncbi:unnamed protein product [Caenorhabditis angaria]|uniref:Uncharacterized protein n=1 Tax=Caenorhabditis angaria TaxID=860376 RepID=A0A9P1N4X9_9PELO|nr:unnamed protein product [Caenorhabditis angaria]
MVGIRPTNREISLTFLENRKCLVIFVMYFDVCEESNKKEEKGEEIIENSGMVLADKNARAIRNTKDYWFFEYAEDEVLDKSNGKSNLNLKILPTSDINVPTILHISKNSIRVLNSNLEKMKRDEYEYKGDFVLTDEPASIPLCPPTRFTSLSKTRMIAKIMECRVFEFRKISTKIDSSKEKSIIWYLEGLLDNIINLEIFMDNWISISITWKTWRIGENSRFSLEFSNFGLFLYDLKNRSDRSFYFLILSHLKMSIVPLSREIEFDFYERPSGYIKHVIFFKVIEETSEIKFTLPKTLFGTVMVDLEKTSYDENMGCNLPKNVDVTDISQAEDSDEVTITVPTPITPEDVESFQYYIKISYHTDDADTLEENEDGTFRIRFENSEAFSFFGDELLTTFSISNWFIDVIECNLNRTLPNDYKYSSENPIALEDVTVIYRKNAEPNYEKKFPLEQGIEVQSYSIRVTPGKQQMLSFASVHEVKLTLTEDTNVINFYFPYAGDLKEAGIVAEDGNYTTQKIHKLY